MPKLTPAQMKAAVEEFKKRFTPGYYHGSPNPNIKAFDPMKSTVRDVDFVTPGVTFVTKSPKFADSFTAGKGPYISLKTGEAIPLGSYNKGSTMYPVSVDMANHFDPMSPEGRLLIEAYVAKKYADDPKMARQFKSRIEDPHSNWTTMESPAFLQHLRESGIKTFDVNESGYQNVGVLDPSKIRGKFAKYNPEDAESPDFMKAQGGLVGYAPGGKVGALEALAKTFFKPVKAGDTVSGMVVRKDIPNTSSIGASLYDYSTHGVQEVPMSAFTVTGKPKYRSVEEENYTKDLARQIQANKELNPLIVVKDDQGYYVLEGAHRFDALRELGTESFPAYMVHDLELLNK